MKKKIILLTLLLAFSKLIWGQSAIQLEESVPYTVNGFEYGFNIDQKFTTKNVLFKSNKVEYELTFYVKNNNDLPYIRFIYSNGEENICDFLAEFNCTNSLKKKKEDGNFFIYGKPKMVPFAEKKFYTQYVFNTPVVYSYDKQKDVLAGYTLNPKETISGKVTVTTELGSLPIIKVKPYAYTF